MDYIDRDVEEAQVEASPGMANPHQHQHTHPHTPPGPVRGSHEIERVASLTSMASSVSTASEATRRRRRPTPQHRGSSDNTAAGISMSRASLQTQADDLEPHPIALSRIATQRSQHSQTVGRTLSARESRKPLPAFGAGRPYPPPLPHREEYVVEFDGPDDPLHAQNWPMRKKLLTASMLAFTTLTSAFASSIFSPAVAGVSREFGVSIEVGLLGLSFYVLGFAFGPSVWAPLSELRGRRLPIVVSMLGFTCFSAGCATGKDIQTVLICRFFSGIFGACPLAVVAAVFSDLFDNRTRGIALAVFSMAVFSGPFLAGPVGGYTADSHLGWRWTEYLVTIMGGFAFVLDLLFLEETYPPCILVSKAAELRRRTLNWGIHAKQEEIEVDLGELVSKNFSRPLRMLFLEPIVLALSVYTAFIYGLLYLFLTAYPLAFEAVHGFSPGEAGLSFLGMIVGQLLAGAAVIAQQPWYQRKLAANAGVPIPEWRLPVVIAGGVSFAGGILWFGWTAYNPTIHWIVPTLSGILTGFGLMSIFLQAINYLVDAYLMFAASVLAGNTFLRSLFGAGFPLFARQMFRNMGIQWAATLLGCISFALVPIPILFYRYGAKLRQRSTFAPTAPPRPQSSESDVAGEEKSGERDHCADLANLATVPRVDRENP